MDPYKGDYEEEMRLTSKTLKKCLEISPTTTIVYAGHPMQHFFEINKNGWYGKNNRFKQQCLPTPENLSFDDVDGWTKILRKNDENIWFPIPWSKETFALCPRNKKRIIHWLLHIELTDGRV